MTAKKVDFGARPARSVDDFVAGNQGAEPPKPSVKGPVKLKRLTIDVDADLHMRIKIGCAEQGAKMADALRAILEREFPAKS